MREVNRLKLHFGDDADWTELEKICAEFLSVEIAHAQFFLEYIGGVDHENFVGLGRVENLEVVLEFMEKAGAQFIHGGVIDDKWESVVSRSAEKGFDAEGEIFAFLRWLRTQTAKNN
ncbi:MAG TPA: hypothetical protein VK846_00635 [Candidatus Limnocylindria bacterium]|nr:hypothetical protein [Candidatus Limnocylindria bacterium]